MPDYKLLGEFVTHCKRCDLELNHRITLMKGEVPKRVLCLTCQTEHAYRAPAAPKKTASTRALSTQEMGRVRQNHEEDAWKAKLTDKSRTPITYSAIAEYSLDDHVFHPTFGLGVVIGFAEPEKVQLYFEGEVKLLKGKRVVLPTDKKARKFG